MGTMEDKKAELIQMVHDIDSSGVLGNPNKTADINEIISRINACPHMQPLLDMETYTMTK